MPNFCAVIGCSNHAVKGDGKSFYRIPSIVSHQGEQTRLLTIKRREGWLQALRRKDLNLKHSNQQYKYDQYRICSDHFITGTPATLYEVSNPDWIPSVNMGHNGFPSAGKAGSQQNEPSKKGTKRKIQDDGSQSNLMLPETTAVCEEADPSDQQDQSLVGELQVKVETEEIQIQHSQQTTGLSVEIREVIIKEETIIEEPDVSSFSTITDIHGIGQTPSSQCKMQSPIERSFPKLCENMEEYVVKHDEMYELVKEEDKTSECFRLLESSDTDDSEIDYETLQLMDTNISNGKTSRGATTIVPLDFQAADMEDFSESDDSNLNSPFKAEFIHELKNYDKFTTEFPKKKRQIHSHKFAMVSTHEQGEDCERHASVFESWKKMDINPPQLPDPVFPAPECVKTPYEYFNMLFTDEMIAHIADQTNLNAYQQAGSSINTTPKEVEIFLSLLLYMGVFDFPSFEDYWRPESRFPPVADAMSTTKFHSLCRYLHFSDNRHSQLDSDRFHKIRPLFTMLRRQCLLIPADNRQNIGAVMVSYSGANIRNLCCRIHDTQGNLGFKLFFRSSLSGIVHDLLLYQGDTTFFGSGSTEDKHHRLLGEQIVTTLCRTITQPETSVVFCDKYLINLNLIKSLEEELRLKCLGPIKTGRVNENDCAKQDFGTYSYVSHEGVIAVKWTEERSLSVLSNAYGLEPWGTVRQSCIGLENNNNNNMVDFPCPSVILACKQAKRAIRLSKTLVNLYKTPVKSRKWYQPLFGYILDLCVANSWLMYRRDCDLLKVKSMSLKRFRLSVASTLKSDNKVLVSTAQQPVSPTPSVPQAAADVRYDCMGHWPVHGKQRGRCNLCTLGMSQWTCSKCGNGKLFLCLNSKKQCFVSYHQP